jgi:hypothetical protein
LFGTDSLSTVFIDLLHQVNTSLIFLAPFVLFELPLFLGLEPS